MSLLGIESVDRIREKAIIELTPGIFAKVIKDGWVKPGDELKII